MKMIEIIGAFVLGGAAGAYAKDKLFGGQEQKNSKQQEIDSLYSENEKFSKRNKELERQVEDLLAELSKIRKQAKNSDDEHDDLEDDLQKAKNEVKKARQQYDEMALKLQEYKRACESQEAEISMLKEKIR